jgi:hypothetical protein
MHLDIEKGSGELIAKKVHGSSKQHASTSLKQVLFFSPTLLHRTIWPARGHRWSMQFAVNVGRMVEWYLEKRRQNLQLSAYEQMAVETYITGEPMEIDMSFRRNGEVHGFLHIMLQDNIFI